APLPASGRHRGSEAHRRRAAEPSDGGVGTLARAATAGADPRFDRSRAGKPGGGGAGVRYAPDDRWNAGGRPCRGGAAGGGSTGGGDRENAGVGARTLSGRSAYAFVGNGADHEGAGGRWDGPDRQTPVRRVRGVPAARAGCGTEPIAGPANAL